MKYQGRSCILSNYSSLPTLVDLWSVLSKEEISLFKTIALGHLTDILRDQSWSSTIFCFLMSRQIKSYKQRIVFWKDILSLIFGLRFWILRDKDTNFDSKPSKLRQKYFYEHKSIVGQDLYDYIFYKMVSKDRVNEVVGETSDAPKIVSKKMMDLRAKYEGRELVPCEVNDKVKVALFYVVNIFLLWHQDIHGVEEDLWHLVDKLSEFNKYSWDERVYKATLVKNDGAFQSQIRKEESNGKEKKKPFFKPKGTPQALVVRFLMQFPGVMKVWGTKKSIEGWHPHILEVLCTKVVKHQQLCESVKHSDVSEEMLRYRNESVLLVILGAFKGPLSYKQLEDLEAEVRLGNQWQYEDEVVEVWEAKNVKKGAHDEDQNNAVNRPDEIQLVDIVADLQNKLVQTENRNKEMMQMMLQLRKEMLSSRRPNLSEFANCGRRL
ncbi:hypothetical protein MKX01_015493 [Papaver californicum]|nr:hypothetical protein MKX01_015493 [Papaver californicum]